LRAAPLGPAFDLLAAYEPTAGFFFEREGLGVAAAAAAGPAIEADVDLRGMGRRALEALRGFGPPDPGAPSPLAVGALPFAAAAAALTIPARVVRRTEGGETWLIEIEDAAPLFRPERPAPGLPHDAFRPVQLTELPDARAYLDAVEEAVRRIRGGLLSKAVLARTIEVAAARTLDPKRLLHRLRAADPPCFVFGAPTGAGSALVGASPELLVSRRGTDVRTTPLAGSAPRSGDPDEDHANAEALRVSAKNREEHHIVVEAVADALGRFCDDLNHDLEPVLLPTANVWHLATRFRGTLRDPTVSAVDLVAELHPTPAVCGTPRDAARTAIADLEPFDRGRYAGPVGWMDVNGDGEWAIALRCAELEGEHATLYAGAGIVRDSDPASELDETQRKFRAFLDSLRWG
jgi:isochorismate synthase